MVGEGCDDFFDGIALYFYCGVEERALELFSYGINDVLMKSGRVLAKADVACSAGSALSFSKVSKEHTRAADLFLLYIAAYSSYAFAHLVATLLIGCIGYTEILTVFAPDEEVQARDIFLRDVVQDTLAR